MDVLAFYTLAGVNVTSRLRDAGNYSHADIQTNDCDYHI